ncbi:unnamed protein product [Urochloa decumbens]|uniref:Uncharacterized protein n=1 Tax=Urochloa decumbens TaxID=240449 RepID=A0ABC9DBS5_9POAL
MEAVHLLPLGMAFVFLVAVFRRDRTTTRPREHTIVVSDPAIIRSALIDHADAFSNRPLPRFPAGRPITHSITSAPYGPLWQGLRRNFTADILHRSRLGVLTPLEREAAAAAVASLSAQAGNNGDVVIRNTLHGAVLALFARLCFGADDDNGMDERALRTVLQMQQEFLSNFTLVRATDRSWLTRLLHWRRRRRHAGVFDRIDEVFIPAIMARRRRQSRDGDCGDGFRSYLDSLLELDIPIDDDDDGRARRPLTDEEIGFLIWEFLSAGTSSTVTCLEWTLAHLAAEPGIQDKLHREVAADHLRSMTEDVAVTLGEAAVPPGGASVTFVLGAFGRDGEVWTNPDEFRPERFLEGGEGEGVSLVPGPKEIKMMPFSAGRRHCAGVAMGMAHVKCFLAEFVRELEWAQPADGSGIDFTELDEFIKWMKMPLRVRVAPRLLK